MGRYVEILKEAFKQLKIKAEVRSCDREGAFLIFDIILQPGGTFKRLEKFATEIALFLKALSNPLIYPITNEGIIRMEVLIDKQDTVLLSDLSMSNEFVNSKSKLPLTLGCKRNGSSLVADLTTMPHLLIGGATGSGKSIMLHNIINGLIMSNKDIKFALIDPKRVEFSYYDNMKSLYAPIAKDPESALTLLQSLIVEMERRFRILEKAKVRDITAYKKKMPYIVVVIDELADLMMSSKKDTQALLCRLAQKSRACGIHLVIATQRPSVDVVTGVIKANFPARLALQVSSNVDSRILLDKSGAEILEGRGDAILDCVDHSFTRFKGAFVCEKEIHKNSNYERSLWRRLCMT